MPDPLVSVVIATHNRQDLLPEAVKSIQHQTCTDVEIIIVDDASQDNTPAVIARLAESDPRIRALRSEKNVGPSKARNMGVAISIGQYIAIMDDDDLAEPQRLAIQIATMEENPGLEFVFSSVAWVNEAMEQTGVFPGIVESGEFPSDSTGVFKLLYLESNKIPNQTITTKRSLWKRFSYPEQIRIGEDWFLFMQLAAKGVRMKPIPTPLVRVRRGDNRKGLMNSDLNTIFDSQREVLRMIRLWLSEEGIHEFDYLHKPALANQILRESRHFVGIKGLMMIARSFLLWSRNPKVKEQLRWYFEKLKNKISIQRKGK